jgi:HD-like signal output (HDOD) protein
MYHWLRRFFLSSSSSTPARIAPPPAAEPLAVEAAEPAPPAPFKASMLSALQRADVNANFTSWLFDDRNRDDPFTNRQEDAVLAALNEILHSRQSGADLVRRMPGVVPQLLQKLRSDDFSGAELARLISNDLVLVAGVVRLANSALYNRNKPIASIEQAILVLGQAGLRQLITSVAFKPIIDLNSGRFTKSVAPRLWEQSEHCASANRMLAERAGIEPFDAFLAGLAQNVGLIVSLRVIDQVTGAADVVGSESFCNALVRCTRGLSCSIAREWRFPATVVATLEEAGSNRKFTELSPIGRILAIGDYLSKTDILLRHNRLHPDDPRLVAGLSDGELACLRALHALPATAATSDAQPAAGMVNS